MDDALLMGVLDGLADRQEQGQALARRQTVFVAVSGDRYAVNELHREIGPPARGFTSVQHAGDVYMVHQGQRFAFGFEAGDHLPAVHSRFE